MATTTDELITRWTLDPKGYVAGAAVVTKQTNRMAAEAAHARASFGGFGTAIKSFGSIARGAAIGVAGLAAGFAALAVYSINKYAEYEQLQLTFVGLYKDAEKAAQMMKALEAYSLKSVLPEEALREASVGLTQLGLSVERYLPLIERLAAGAPGKFNPEGIRELVALLMRLKGGDITAALGAGEGVGRFGIGKDSLKEMGAVFDKSGAFVGNWQQALAIIEKASTKNQGILDQMEGSAAAKISNAIESFMKVVRDFGGVMAGEFLPVMEQVSNFARYLSDTGVFKQMSAAFANLFGSKGESPFVTFLSWVVATISTIPDLIQNIVGNLSSALDFLRSIPFIRHLVDLGTSIWKGIGKGFSSMSGIGDIALKQKEIMSGFTSYNPDARTPAFPDAPSATATEKTPSVFEAIERNTRLTAENTGYDLTRNVVGGGDLARRGVTATMRGRKSNSAQARFFSALEDLLEDAKGMSAGRFQEAQIRA